MLGYHAVLPYRPAICTDGEVAGWCIYREVQYICMYAYIHVYIQYIEWTGSTTLIVTPHQSCSMRQLRLYIPVSVQYSYTHTSVQVCG